MLHAIVTFTRTITKEVLFLKCTQVLTYTEIHKKEDAPEVGRSYQQQGFSSMIKGHNHEITNRSYNYKDNSAGTVVRKKINTLA